MRKSKLSERDVEICRRFHSAREWLGRTQAEISGQLSIERTTLQNYEHCRTPLRFEVALRFCRQFIVSEEWLATGKYASCWAAAPRHGVKAGAGKEVLETKIFRRQCVDLLSEPASLHIAPGTLFGDAYDATLAPQYARLVNVFFYFPRIVLTDSDIPELAINFLTAVNERFVVLLQNEALRRKQKGSSAWRVYARHMLECSNLVFRKMMRLPVDSAYLSSLEWLRLSASNPSFVIPFLEDPERSEPSNDRKIVTASA